MNPTAYKAPTAAERLAYMKDYTTEMQQAAGESPSAGMRKYIQEQREALGKEREEAKGLAALQAIPAILQPGGTIRGLGAAAASIGGSMAEANKMQRAAKNQFAQMEFNLADADRKERMGLHRDARAAFDTSEQNKIAGLKLDREAKAAAGNVIGKLAQANRVTGAGAGAGSAKEFIVGPATYLPAVQRQFPGLSDEEHKAIAFERWQQNKSAGLPGVVARTESNERTKASELAAKRRYMDPDWNAASRKKDTTAVAAREQALFEEELAKLRKTSGGGGSAGGGSGDTVGRSNW